MKILFVCTGNTCRSPMAEAIFNFLCKKSNKQHTAISRGTDVYFVESINKKALFSLSNLGINDFTHYSQKISEQDVSDSDLILTMSSSHKMTLKNKFKRYADKIYTLNEKAYGKDFDIPDPFGQSEQVYFECAKSIYDAVAKVVKML